MRSLKATSFAKSDNEEYNHSNMSQYIIDLLKPSTEWQPLKSKEERRKQLAAVRTRRSQIYTTYRAKLKERERHVSFTA